MPDSKSIVDFLKEESNLFDKILNKISDLILLLDQEGRVIYANQAVKEILGLEVADIIGKKCDQIPTATDSYQLCAKDDLRQIKDQTVDKYIPKLDKYFSYNTTKLKEEFFIVQITDITDRKRLEQKVEYLNYHDILTGLYNRNYLNKMMIEFAQKKYLPVSIIVGDINGLKLINDTFGYQKGDQYIKEAADIIEAICPKKAVIVRYGGDEFIIILPKMIKKEASKLIKEINQENSQSEVGSFPLSIAFGVATKREAKEDLQGILQRAEKLSYKNKLTDDKSSRANTLSTLLATLGEKTNETEEHSLRLAQYAFMLGERISLNDEDLDRLNLLATLHDIGKIAVPENILNKADRLTEQEWETIKGHPRAGYRILRDSQEFSHVAEEVLAHHEKWNGEGYPQGLKGADIPLLARIITIVDSYDVMTHKRPYKEAMSKDAAIEELKRCSGSQFDPELTTHFVEILTENDGLF